MRKSKILLCLGLGALLSSTALMASPKQNEFKLKGLNVEKVENVQNKNSKGNQLRLHYYRDDKEYTGWNIWFWAGSDGGSSHVFDTDDGYGVCTTINLTDAKYDGVKTFNYVVRKSVEGNEWAEKDGKTGDDRSFTIPDAVDIANNGYDVYFYKKDDNTYTAVDGPGKNYLQWMARNNIEKLSTKAQLQYTFEKKGEDYSFSNMKINFGALIKKEHIDNLVASGVDIKNLAVAVFKKTDLAAGKSAKDAVWKKESYVKISEKVFNYSELVAKGTTDETGTSSTGDYIMFSADLKYPAGSSYYTEEVYAVAYIDLVDGESIGAAMLNEKLCSVSSLADEYVASEAFSSFTVYAQESLMALSVLND